VDEVQGTRPQAKGEASAKHLPKPRAVDEQLQRATKVAILFYKKEETQ